MRSASGRIAPSARYALPLLALLLVAGLVAATEAWIAWRDPGLLQRDPTTGDEGLLFYRFHPEVGLFHKSGFSSESAGIVYVMNSRGLRGPEIGEARVPGRRRVVVLGDSLVWGLGVPEGETVCAALASLRADVDVLNFGVAGFGTGQELALLEAEALAYRPDRVILVFTLANDVEDSYYPDTAESYPANVFHLVDGALHVDRFSLSLWQQLGLWLRHNSYVAAFAARSQSSASAPASSIGEYNLRRLHATDFKGRSFSGRRYLDHPALEPRHQARRGGLLAPTAANHYKVELVKELIRAMAGVTREAGAEFSVVLAPFRAQLSTDHVLRANPLTVELSRFLRDEGIEHLDLLPHLLASRLPARPLFVDRMHLSARGNRILAERIAEAWIPVRSSPGPVD